MHNDIQRSRRDLGIEFYDESTDLVEKTKTMNMDSTTINRNPTSDSELSDKQDIDG